MNIVVGYLDSPEGEAAIDQAIEESKLRGGKVVVVHSMVGGDHEDIEDYRRNSAAMETAHEKLHAAGIDHCTHEYVRGQEPVKDLMGAVADHEAGMIVIGIRSRSATGKLILGSNALDILRDATVPVLCVKRKAVASAE